MKIVVAGALGHIGSAAIREIPMGYEDSEVILIDNMLTQRYCSMFDLPEGINYRLLESDILEMDLHSVIEGADVVLQLAAITDAAGSFANKSQVEHNNFNTTAKLATACCDVDVPMIHMSSTSVYGTQAEVVDEGCSVEELNPQSPYAETKLNEERYLQELGSTRGFKFVTLRCGTICGVSPGMRFHTAVNKFCWQAVMGQPLTVWRTALHQKRPYLILSDAIEAYKFIISKQLFDRKVYNVLTDNLTVNNIVECIGKNIPSLDIQYVDSEIMNQLSYEVLNHRFTDKGFKFMGSVEKSIRETIDLLSTCK